LTFSKDGRAFYTAPDSGVAALLLALLCHEHETRGSTVACDLLTVEKASLLACYRPSRVRSEVAHPAAVALLGRAGVAVDAASVSAQLASGEDSTLVRLRTESDSPEAFRDELRMRLLTSLQKSRGVADGWVDVTPESFIGYGGGGT
jgi:hypothetical protein